MTINTYGQLRVFNEAKMHVFETGEESRKHGENIQPTVNLNTNPSSCEEDIQSLYSFLQNT